MSSVVGVVSEFWCRIFARWAEGQPYVAEMINLLRLIKYSLYFFLSVELLFRFYQCSRLIEFPYRSLTTTCGRRNSADYDSHSDDDSVPMPRVKPAQQKLRSSGSKRLQHFLRPKRGIFFPDTRFSVKVHRNYVQLIREVDSDSLAFRFQRFCTCLNWGEKRISPLSGHFDVYRELKAQWNNCSLELASARRRHYAIESGLAQFATCNVFHYSVLRVYFTAVYWSSIWYHHKTCFKGDFYTGIDDSGTCIYRGDRGHDPYHISAM